MTLELDLVPDKAFAVRREKTVVAALWFGPWVRRPYVYPFLAPGDLEVTRLGHPEDPVGHSHHRSIWIGHHDVLGADFWSDTPASGRIALDGIREQSGKGESAGAILDLSWIDAQGKKLLEERRRLTFHDLPDGELALDLEIELRAAASGEVTLGATPFGLLGVRVARTIRVHERLGGRVENSEEAQNESGCFGQHARWCDYSGPVPAAPAGAAAPPPSGTLPAAIIGIACFDHPANSPGGETQWHVRDDGWMGPSLTRSAPRVVGSESPLRVRYRIESHAGRAGEAAIGERYRAWLRSAR